MKYLTKTHIQYGLLTKNYWAKPEVLLFAATLLKAILILLFYQHIIDYENPPSRLASGYGWDQLVSSMHDGKYTMVMQSGLSDIYDLRSYSYRPPIYSVFLFLTTYLSYNSALIIILLQSIITSLVAYLGYKIVRLSTSRETYASICLWTLFLLPMNFLKTGTIDEAPLMLVFVLASLYILGKFIRNQDKYVLLILSGILLGLSTMTRYTTLMIPIGILLYICKSRVFDKKLKKMLLFTCAYIFILLPWIYRNYSIYSEPVLSVGGSRVLLFTQSEEFIESFPYESPDSIEQRYLRSFHKSHKHLSQLNAFALDKEFRRYAILEAINSPWKYLRSLTVKLKVFLPYRYFPKQNNIIKDIVYVVSYSLSLLFFIWSILKCKRLTCEYSILLISLIGLIIPGITYFILSRHLYPIIIVMIIFSCTMHLKHNNHSPADL